MGRRADLEWTYIPCVGVSVGAGGARVGRGLVCSVCVKGRWIIHNSDVAECLHSVGSVVGCEVGGVDGFVEGSECNKIWKRRSIDSRCIRMLSNGRRREHTHQLERPGWSPFMVDSYKMGCDL